jgi:hypothetical protein
MDRGRGELGPYLAGLADWMLVAVEDPEPTVAKGACDFWVKVFLGTRADVPDLHEQVSSLMPHLVRALVERLLLSPEAQENPGSTSSSPATSSPGLGEGSAKQPLPSLSGLRRSAAAGLDALASSSGSHAVLPVVLPLLQARLVGGDTWEREAAILGLGAIAECQRGGAMDPHLPHVFPFLVKQLGDGNPQIRRISCWAISRYASWAFEQQPPAAGEEASAAPQGGLCDEDLSELLKGLMMRVLDRHALVQVRLGFNG